jgi:DNA mismatch endonuclease (patch repair protein)
MNVTADQRHRAMAHNRGRTKPELAFASALWRRGLRYLTARGYRAVSGSRLPGEPDLIFPRKRVVVFVDGCFWHGCLACGGFPTGREFWDAKIQRTQERDRRYAAELEAAGWRVVRVWEHDVRTRSRREATADALAEELRGATAP